MATDRQYWLTTAETGWRKGLFPGLRHLSFDCAYQHQLHHDETVPAAQCTHVPLCPDCAATEDREGGEG